MAHDQDDEKGSPARLAYGRTKAILAQRPRVRYNRKTRLWEVLVPDMSSLTGFSLQGEWPTMQDAINDARRFGIARGRESMRRYGGWRGRSTRLYGYRDTGKTFPGGMRSWKNEETRTIRAYIDSDSEEFAFWKQKTEEIWREMMVDPSHTEEDVASELAAALEAHFRQLPDEKLPVPRSAVNLRYVIDWKAIAESLISDFPGALLREGW